MRRDVYLQKKDYSNETRDVFFGIYFIVRYLIFALRSYIDKMVFWNGNIVLATKRNVLSLLVRSLLLHYFFNAILVRYIFGRMI